MATSASATSHKPTSAPVLLSPAAQPDIPKAAIKSSDTMEVNLLDSSLFQPMHNITQRTIRDSDQVLDKIGIVRVQSQQLSDRIDKGSVTKTDPFWRKRHLEHLEDFNEGLGVLERLRELLTSTDEAIAGLSKRNWVLIEQMGRESATDKAVYQLIQKGFTNLKKAQVWITSSISTLEERLNNLRDDNLLHAYKKIYADKLGYGAWLVGGLTSIASDKLATKLMAKTTNSLPPQSDIALLRAENDAQLINDQEDRLFTFEKMKRSPDIDDFKGAELSGPSSRQLSSFSLHEDSSDSIHGSSLPSSRPAVSSKSQPSLSSSSNVRRESGSLPPNTAPPSSFDWNVPADSNGNNSSNNSKPGTKQPNASSSSSNVNNPPKNAPNSSPSSLQPPVTVQPPATNLTGSQQLSSSSSIVIDPAPSSHTPDQQPKEGNKTADGSGTDVPPVVSSASKPAEPAKANEKGAPAATSDDNTPAKPTATPKTKSTPRTTRSNPSSSGTTTGTKAKDSKENKDKDKAATATKDSKEEISNQPNS